ncbi:MAG TPA: competence/damage-inducible protein A [Acidimicrobiia bacterium]|nr:competence/damage-inducible protein A [Acidimicrobiia bacterium]
MIVEVVAVGTELLLGQIVNGNAATIGSALALNGFDAHFQQVVGDNHERIVTALGLAAARADAVIITGGIGPTQDDITREALCALTGRSMVRNEEYVEVLQRRFASMGREMPDNNRRQADHPEGAEQLGNPKGTAPGIALFHEGTWFFALPGVPEEMDLLLTDHVLPRLRAAAGDNSTLHSRVLRSWGLSESAVAATLDDLYTGSTNPSIAFLASGGEIKIRITAKAADVAAAEAMIGPVEAEVRERLGPAIFGTDADTIEPVVARLLEDEGWTVAFAESATGGLVASRFTAVPGVSRVFRGAIVPYAAETKDSVLGVDIADGVVTEEVALALAEAVRARFGADVGVGVTGSAGPASLEREVGTMMVAVVTPEGEGVRTLRFPGDRERVRTYTATAALHLARLGISGRWWNQ